MIRLYQESDSAFLAMWVTADGRRAFVITRKCPWFDTFHMPNPDEVLRLRDHLWRFTRDRR